MTNQKLENLLNLALSIAEAERERSSQLSVGFLPELKKWEVIVKYHGDLKQLENDLITVEELIAGYAIVTLPETLIQSFSQLDEIEYVEKPKRLYTSLLNGKQASCVFPVTQREPYLNGEGTLVAVIDSGIDYQNPEFLTSDGSTRILSLWDQTLDAGQVNALLPDAQAYLEYREKASPPTGFATGVEFSRERINAALQSQAPFQIVPSRDTSGHGSAVAAIAAGSGSFSSGQFHGIAPSSELLIVKMGASYGDSFPKTTSLLRAVTYVLRKASEAGKPLAINLSFGNTYGSHDGTSLVERFLDNASEIGRTVICVGSGNEGATGGHAAGSFPEAASSPQRIELSVGAYQPTLNVQLWKDFSDDFGIRLLSPGGERLVVDVDRPGKSSYLMENTEILLYVGDPSPYSVKQEIYFDFLPVESYVNQGVWTFELTPRKVVIGSYDFYLPSSNILNAATRFFTPTPEKTLTIPSTSSKVITVGAYNAYFDAYADFSGRGYPLESISLGRLLSSAIKPDLVAPGADIMTIGPNDTFVQVSGTSFAVPFVTGSASLLLEWGIVRGNDPFLYGEKVKAYLRRGARPIQGERGYPNAKVGFGGLCLEESLFFR